MPRGSSSAVVWSPAKTVAWYGAIFAVDLVLQSLILILATGLVLTPGAGREEVSRVVHALAHDGQVFVAAAFASATLVISAVTLLTRRNGSSAFEYLGVRPVSVLGALPYLAIGAGFAALQVVVFEVFNIPSTDFWHGIFLSSWLKPILFMAVVFAAPIAEEVMYRGFLFRGLLSSRLGPVGAVILTSAAWAMVHMQYNVYEKISIFALGLVLGTIRYRRDSITLTMLIHIGVNVAGFVMILAGY